MILKEKRSMRSIRFLSLLVVFALVLTPLAVFAQDDEEIELEVFVSEDGMLTVGYPKEWIVQEPDLEESGVPGIMMAASEDTLSKLDSEEDTSLTEGEVAIQVLLLPVDLLPLMGFEMPEGELDLLVVADTLAASLIEEDEEALPEGEEPENKAEEIDLREDVVAGYVTVLSPDLEGALFAFEVNDGVLAIVLAGAYPGEFTEELNDLAQAIAASLEYAGTGAELMTLLMGGGGPIAEPTPAVALDGAALVEERCTVCHDTERIDKERAEGADLAKWEEIVDEMIGKGAQLDDDERAAVIEYLASTD
jgi:hypothetical protein